MTGLLLKTMVVSFLLFCSVDGADIIHLMCNQTDVMVRDAKMRLKWELCLFVIGICITKSKPLAQTQAVHGFHTVH